MKPESAKILQIVVSIGHHDSATPIDEFFSRIKAGVIKECGDTVLLTLLYGEHQYDGKRYRQQDWEQWDGNPETLPIDVYTKLSQPKPLVPVNTLSTKQLTSDDVVKALDDHREALGLPPRVMASTEADTAVESLSDASGWPRVDGWEDDPWVRLKPSFVINYGEATFTEVKPRRTVLRRAKK